MRILNMAKVFIYSVLCLMFSGLIGWLTWNFVGVILFFGGVGYGIYGAIKKDWFKK